MPFTDRFQLLDLKRDEGARTFEAREIATGRPVFVHLFADRTPPLNRALLAKIDALPEPERHRIIDRGDHEGGVYVVTDRLAEYGGLREWLKAQDQDRPKQLDVAGAWRVKPPVPTPVEPVSLTDTGEQTLEMRAPVGSAPDVSPPKAPPPTAGGQGEFTRQFAPPILRPTPAPAPPAAPVPPPGDPGEFTRQFAPPVLRPAASPKDPVPPAAAVPQANEPGEFTRQFAPPVLRPAPVPPPAKEAARPAVSPAPANEPGEFTRQFAPPVLRPTAPTPAPTAQPPGEFTQMFSASPVPQKGAVPAGDFTKQFQAPQRPVSPPREAASPENPTLGEFTQMLQAQRVTPPAPPPSQAPQASEFTQYFQSPMAPTEQMPNAAPLTPPRPPSPTKGAGEFTQIFGRGDLPTAPPPPAPAAPPAPVSSNATQVFVTPRPAAAPGMPAQGPSQIPSSADDEYSRLFAKPAPLTFGQAPVSPQTPRFQESAPSRRNKSLLPLLLVLGATVLLIIAIIVYFVMRPHAS